jgi:ABC-type glycerol-3-phosphate transport system substrate-binding protein
MPCSSAAPRRRLMVGVLAASVMAVAACSSSGGATSKADPNATLLIWTDATRQPGFEQFSKAHPDVKMKIETYDGSSLLTKIQLFNRTGKGWPDVIFDGQPNNVAALSSPLFNYTQPLDELIPEQVKQGYGTANATCTLAGKTVCLKNDLAQTVLWYDTKLMSEFGYQVPTTWAEYTKLGLRIAEEHPGYIVGTAGSEFATYDYFQSSGCPLQTVTGPQAVHIDTKDPKCTRVAAALDPLIKAGVVTRGGPFDPETAKLGQQKKVLMMPGASWFGDFLFKPASSFGTPKGRIAAAAYPTWEGEPKNYSGAAGGGVYMVSRHSANTKQAAAIAQWMATDLGYQKSAPTYPAYGLAAKAWGEAKSTDAFYAIDPFPVLQKQASLINPVVAPISFDVPLTVTNTVAAKIRSGGTLRDGLADLQTQLASLAQSVGYAVD